MDRVPAKEIIVVKTDSACGVDLLEPRDREGKRAVNPIENCPRLNYRQPCVIKRHTRLSEEGTYLNPSHGRSIRLAIWQSGGCASSAVPNNDLRPQTLARTHWVISS